MAYLLPVEKYDDVRMALDPTLDEGAIPDELISSKLYQGRAEKWLLSHDPLAATRSGDDQEQVHLAIALKTASLLSPTLPQVKQTNMAGHSATLAFAETPAERGARLANEAYDIVTILLEIIPDDIGAGILFVTTVSGRRG